LQIGVHLTTPDAQLTIPLFAVFLLFLDQLPHTAGVTPVLEINGQHHSINPQDKTAAEEHDE
jgi:hypothetical protein